MLAAWPRHTTKEYIWALQQELTALQGDLKLTVQVREKSRQRLDDLRDEKRRLKLQIAHVRARQELAQQVDVLRQGVSAKELDKESLLHRANASFGIHGINESTIVIDDVESGGNASEIAKESVFRGDNESMLSGDQNSVIVSGEEGTTSGSDESSVIPFDDDEELFVVVDFSGDSESLVSLEGDESATSIYDEFILLGADE